MMKRAFLILSLTALLGISGCGSGTNPIVVAISSPTGAQALDVGQTFNITASVSNDKLAKGATFLLTGAGTLSNQTATSATYTASASGNGTITVASASDPTKTKTITVVVTAAPSITSATTLSPATEGAAYTGNIAVTGGAGSLNYSVTVGSLPAGLSLNSSTGAITGTATGPGGTVNFTVQVKDSSTVSPQTNSKAMSVIINLPPAPQITTTTLPADVEGTAYSQPLALTGGLAPFTYSISAGSLPAGLSINAGTGAITGMSTGPNGTASFTVKVADSSNPVQTATQPLSIAVNLPPPPAITTTTLPGVAEFANYSQTLAATGYGPFSYSVSVGTLPPGLSLNSSTGAITGAPTGPNSTSSFTIKVTDSSNPAQSGSQPLSIAVSLPPAPSITTTTLPNGIVGANYSQTIVFTGGHGPFTWSISAGALPTGFSLNTATGAITGSSNTVNTYSFTVKVVDSSNPAQTASQPLSISIVTGPLLVTPATLPTGAINDPYPSTTLGASGGLPPYTWAITVGSLPAGLSLNVSTGAVTGTPTGPSGTANFTAQVTDSASTKATGSFSIIVNPVLAITSTSLPGATAGTNYSTNLSATGGVTPYNWSISAGSLPTGMNLSGNTISGIATTAGTVSFTIMVNDASGGSQSAAVSIVVAPAPPLTVATTSGSLPQGVLNTIYPSTQLNATGGFSPYTWSQVLPGAGPLPPGMGLSSNGNITGTPTSTGTYPFTVQVTDSATPTANTANATLSITVSAAAACTSGGSESLLNGQYAFVLKGFDAGTATGETGPQPVLVGGVLTFNGANNGGLITAGTIDINQNSGFTTNTVTSGSYGVTSDHRGCMVITTSAGTQNYRFSLGNITSGVASTGHVIDFDIAGPYTTGILRKQTVSAFSTSQVTGNYAFGVASPQNVLSCNNGTNCGGNFGAVGVFNLSTGSITGGEVDFNNNGQLDGSTTATNFPTSPISINAGGTYTISSTSGRGTLDFTPAGTGGTAVTTVIYVVSSTEVLVLDSDLQTNNSLFAGELLKQSGTFSANPLSGAYVGYQSSLGFTTAGTSRATLILLSASGTGISGTQLRNDGGSFQSKSLSSLTYSVTSTGRMTFTSGTNQPVLYLVSPNQAFFLNGNTNVDTGFFQSQTGGPFTNSSASGAYAFGAIDPQDANADHNSGVATFTPATTNISVTEDKNGNGSQNTGQTQSFTYSIDSTGLVHIPSGCTISATSTTCQTVLFVISPTKAVIMDTSSTNPNIQVADQ
jgi:hypothetical protein